MSFVVTGFGPIDAPHRDLARCVADLAAAVRARDAAEVRGRACLLTEKLAEHFSEEEALMRQSGWSLLGRHAEAHGRLLTTVRGFELGIARHGVSHALSFWGQYHLPELIRHHCIVSDFGFAKFALGLAVDPAAHPGLRRSVAGRTRVPVASWRARWKGRRRDSS